MDNKKAYLKYVDFCASKYEKALNEYSKYNGFTSQLTETQRKTGFNYLEMGVMSEYTQSVAQFWNDKKQKAIMEFHSLFNSAEEAMLYASKFGKTL